MKNPRFDDTQPKIPHPDANADFYAAPNPDFFGSGEESYETPGEAGYETPAAASDGGTNAGGAYPGGEYEYDYDTTEEAPYPDGTYPDAEGYAWQDGREVPVYDGYSPAPKRSLWWLWVLGGLAILVVALLLGGGLGYFSGIQERVKAQAVQIQGSLKEQYDLAMTDMAEGRYQVAQQRLEYIIKNLPDYPGAADKLTEAKTILSMTQSVPGATQPAVVLLPGETPTITPTPDLRNAEQMYQSAKTAMAGKDWTNAVDVLLKIRKGYPDYESVRIDGLLYVCYRNRGITKIINSELEGGTYDFSLAEKYGPLDAEAQNYRDWVNFYTIGASFWELDWGQSAQYFGQVASLAPQLRDSSGLPAIQRYQTALGNYADQLAKEGNACEAEEQYNIAIQSGRADMQPTAQYVHDICTPPEATPDPNVPTTDPNVPTAEPTAQ